MSFHDVSCQNCHFRSKPSFFIKTQSTGSNPVNQGKKCVHDVLGKNRPFRSKPLFFIKTGSARSNHVDQSKKWVFMMFMVKTVIFGQNRHFLSKPSPPGQTMSTRVKKCVFSPFRGKTIIFDQNQVHRVHTCQTMSTGVKKWVFRPFRVKTINFWSKPGSPGWYPSNVFFVFQHNFR